MPWPLRARALAAAVCAAFAGTAEAGVVEPRLRARLAGGRPDDEVAVIVRLSARARPVTPGAGARAARATALVASLRAAARDRLPPVSDRLHAAGARAVQELWAIDALAARIRAGTVETLAADPAVESVGLDAVVLAPAVGGGARPTQAPGTAIAAAIGAPGWNLAAVGAPALWAMGRIGAGVVVASMDTGVDPQHPDLAGKWRGGSNGWFDPHGEHATPHDASGHGTQTMGLLVGGSDGGAAIGMAPGARWIAVKQYDDAGKATLSDIHRAFQWLLDPDGDPATPDAPDVVNASWGLVDAAEPCSREFEADVQLLRSAGIAIAFSAGNDGPAPASGVSPADNAPAFAVGAVDGALEVASFSSRGPSACDGGIFPRIVAPGVGVMTADLSFGGLPLYGEVWGTSYSAPHVAGAMALLAGAFPDATVGELEDALVRSAVDIGGAGPDDDSGAGLLDVRAAYDALASPTGPLAVAPAAPASGGGCSSSGGGASLLLLVAALVAPWSRAGGRWAGHPPWPGQDARSLSARFAGQHLGGRVAGRARGRRFTSGGHA
jgi:serine protease AprX